MDVQSQTATPSSQSSEREAYVQPKLVCYGMVRNLTASGSGTNAESQSNQSTRRHP